MNSIQHIIEPERLLLSWQRQMSDVENRPRRIVGVIEKIANEITFRYLVDSTDYQEAIREEFQGYPVFSLDKKEFKTDILSTFIRRLPPRSREDFAQYLTQHRLPKDFSGSDMALLAYTGAKLPGDNFEIIPDMSGTTPPVELMMEIAGFRYQGVDVTHLSVGDAVQIALEPNNAVDENAIAVLLQGVRLGYIPKPYCPAIRNWLNTAKVEGYIERINGKLERPLVYLFLRVKSRET